MKLLSLSLLSLFFVGTSQADINVNGLKCAYSGSDPNAEFKRVHVRFAFNSYFDTDEDGNITVTFGSIYQQNQDGEIKEENGTQVASGRDVAVKVYKARSPEYKAYLGGDGYRVNLDYVAALRGKMSDDPDHVDLYLAQTPFSKDGDNVKYKALLAVKYHDQMPPSYLRLECGNK